MQCPAPVRVPRAPAAAGFSLVEVICALMIAVVMCGAVAWGLSVVLLDEQIQLRQMEAALLPGRLLARVHGTREEPSAPDGWSLETSDLTLRRENAGESWRVFVWTPTNRPGPRVVVARPAGAKPD